MNLTSLMGKDTLIIIGASLLIFIIMIGYGFATMKPPTYETTVSSSPLSPTATFPLLPGEKYVYEFRDPSNSSVHTVYLIGNDSGQSCVPVEGSIPEMGTSISTCIDKDSGKVSQILVTSENGTFLTNASIDFFFSDLTLSLKDGFDWQYNTTSMVTGDYPFNQTLVLSFKVLGEQEIKSRDSFKVELSSYFANERGISASDIPSQIVYIDKEKRVILYSESNESEFELISAPFNMTCISASAGNETACPSISS